MGWDEVLEPHHAQVAGLRLYGACLRAEVERISALLADWEAELG